MVEPICALPPLSESLRDSQGASSVQHWTVIDGMRGYTIGADIRNPTLTLGTFIALVNLFKK